MANNFQNAITLGVVAEAQTSPVLPVRQAAAQLRGPDAVSVGTVALAVGAAAVLRHLAC